MKKNFLMIFMLLVSAFCLPAATTHFDYQNYSADISYLPENFPGDAVFARISFVTNNKKFIRTSLKSKSEEDFISCDGMMKFIHSSDNKKIGEAKFYKIRADKNKKSYRVDVLAGIPLSSYLKPGKYFAEAEFSAFAQEKQKVAFPVEIKEKEFVSETIPLNDSNTKIRTDDSKKRWQQIEKLNKILGTTDESAVYDFSVYTPPTPITRRTSFFADRRIYAYSNGKSSTSLHYGIDFGVPKGNEVRSCAAGKVVMAEERITTGFSVVIEHLPGLYSLYYHNSELKVKEGDIVQKGGLIAISGATGLATGPHVHWEMRLNMEAVSPDFFTADFAFNQQ